MCPYAQGRYTEGVVGRDNGAVSGIRRSESMDEQQWRAALATLPPEARAKAEALLSAYGRLFERHRRVLRRSSALAAALDRIPLALMLVDGDRIVWANATAEELLVQDSPFRRKGSRLTTRSAPLEEALRAVRSGASPRAAVAVEVEGTLWQLLCLASELGGPALIAFAAGDGPALEPKAEELQILFGLTAREAKVATLLLSGHTGREIAQAMDVGFETARSHVKHVLRKMCCPRQAAAVLALATSPATIGPTPRRVASGE